MKWKFFIFAWFVFLLASFSGRCWASLAYYTISGIDPGGIITEYAEKYQALEKTGVTVKVDGLCASACTMVLAYFPADRICMTERAAFGFHEASMDDETDPELTKAWFRVFPDWVLKWVIEHGGVQENPIYAYAEDFKGHIQLCPGSHYPDIDMQKLIKTKSEGERTIFKPQQ